MHLKVIVLTTVALGGMVGYINIHDPWFELATILALGALVSGMPDPTTESTTAYKWAYRSLHLFFNIATHFFAHPSAWRALEPKAGDLEANSHSESKTNA